MPLQLRCQMLLQKPVQYVAHSLMYQSFRFLNSNTASICKIRRQFYARQYPTVVVLSDGSSFNIRYNEPRKIVMLPLDLSTLSEAERLSRLERRKPKKKVKIEDDIDDGYDARKYLQLMKN